MSIHVTNYPEKLNSVGEDDQAKPKKKIPRKIKRSQYEVNLFHLLHYLICPPHVQYMCVLNYSSSSTLTPPPHPRVGNSFA